MLSRWRNMLARKATDQSPQIFDQYVTGTPSHQKAVDALPGWSTRFPPDCSVEAGATASYEDPRIGWAIRRYGSLENRKVLELGSLEGGHTFMLEQAGALVDVVEADRLAFMRRLVAKEILGLTRARFWLGDAIEWLEGANKTYDLIVASDGLDRFGDPRRALELIARRSFALYVFTPASSQDGQNRFEGKALPNAIRAAGFSDIQTASNEADDGFDPGLSILARKSH
jgi:hypothetical protein